MINSTKRLIKQAEGLVKMKRNQIQSHKNNPPRPPRSTKILQRARMLRDHKYYQRQLQREYDYFKNSLSLLKSIEKKPRRWRLKD
jgi:hypothetical protein